MIKRTMVCALYLCWILMGMTGCQGAGREVVFDTRDAVETQETEASATAMTGQPDTEASVRVEALQETYGEVQDQGTKKPQEICVDVCGAVMHPGVYTLREGARVYEAIAMAGGFREDAASELLNQAQLLSDGIQLRVYGRDEAERLEESGAIELPGIYGAEQDASAADEIPGSGNKVNLNTADADQLCTLPGIGAARAADIMAYRESAGSFQKIEDIMNVSGIKDATFQKIRDKIAVE
ncbi:MAG: helix-hairpin-helix domain-containing protein [Eubacteriales bacterium]|nr:helix-hairpin-helix domain-containing protein [Eubacteriales bacterium]